MKRTWRSYLRRLFSPSPDEYHSGKIRQHVFPWRKFGHHYLHALLWIGILIGLGQLLEISGALKGFESVGLDTFLRLHNRKMSNRVVIVEITDEDYADPNLFDGKSPLNSRQLVNLISKIQAYDPAVIAMDFDTESGDWCEFKSQDLAKVLPANPKSQGAPPHPPVVWAEIPNNVEEPLRLRPVLGGKLGANPGDFNYLGVPRFPVDSDGLVRRYEGKFLVSGSMGDCTEKPNRETDIPEGKQRLAVPAERDIFPSFARAIINHACNRRNIDCCSLRQEDKQPVIFNFYGDRYRFPIIQSREFIGPEAEAKSADKNLQIGRALLLRDKIVLVGGNFSAARDVYTTPLGPMAGVELIALAIESDFGGGIRQFQKWSEILADFVVGSLIVFVYFYYRRRPRFAFWLSLIGFPMLAVIFSLILFRTAAYWFNFMPILIGMVMHQMLELSESCGDLQQEIENLECKIREASKNPPAAESIKTADDAPARDAMVHDAIPHQEKIEPPIGEQPGKKR